jgi:hypothetical protein
MNEIQKNEVPSTSSLSKLGITAIGYSVGGVFLFLLQIFSRLRGLGLVLGGVVCILGIGSLMSKDPTDRKAGIIITTAGVLTIISRTGIPVLKAVSATLLTIGSFGLLALGIINGLKFFAGLKKRS